MPSQTIHIPEDEYMYGASTKAEDDTLSGRFAELISKGIEYEQENNGDQRA